MRAYTAPILGVAAFELRRVMRSPATVVGMLIFVVLLAVGHWSYWSALPPRAAGDRMFSLAYIIAMCAILRFGLAEDRDLHFDEFLIVNLVSPLRYAIGKLMATVGVLLAFGVVAFLLGFILGAADWEYAIWYTTLLTLVAWVYLPAILLVELAVATRYPTAFVFVIFVACLTVARLFVGTPTIVDALGLDLERFDYASLVPLTRRALISTWLLALLYPLFRLRIVGRAGWSRADA